MRGAQEAIHSLLDRMDALIGGRSQAHFRRFVLDRWDKGNFAFRVDEDFRKLIDELVELYEAGELDATDCYKPGQLPASNATLYSDSYAIRMVKDSPDNAPIKQRIADYNIEPHIHFVPSIIIVANRPKEFTGHYLVHRPNGNDGYVAAVPLEFGNVICFPENVSHTFKPSDTGLFTINMTEKLIVPQTPDFGADAPVSLDNLELRPVTLSP